MSELNNFDEDLDTSKIRLSDHAYLRAKERLGIKDSKMALNKVREMLKQAKRIGIVFGEDGNEGVYYACNKFGFILTSDLQRVVTIKKTVEVTHPAIKTALINLHKKEFNKLDRLEKSNIKKLNIEKLRINCELAQLEYRKVKTRSKNVREYCEKHKADLHKYITQIEKELKNIQAHKRNVANSMSSIL